jgi:hypothetical protein
MVDDEECLQHMQPLLYNQSTQQNTTKQDMCKKKTTNKNYIGKQKSNTYPHVVWF